MVDYLLWKKVEEPWEKENTYEPAYFHKQIKNMKDRKWKRTGAYRDWAGEMGWKGWKVEHVPEYTFVYGFDLWKHVNFYIFPSKINYINKD